MKVISTNIGKPTKVEWNGKIIETGIYKYPTITPILLQKEDVAHDTIQKNQMKSIIEGNPDLFPNHYEKIVTNVIQEEDEDHLNTNFKIVKNVVIKTQTNVYVY